MKKFSDLWKTRNGKIMIFGGAGFVILLCCIIPVIAVALAPESTQAVEPTTTGFATSTEGFQSPTETPLPAPTSISDLAQAYVDQYGGALNAYIEILSSDDCIFLQEKFDLAAANNDREEPGTAAFRWTLGFMEAADEHMREIGCY